jgi:hypothetical protein
MIMPRKPVAGETYWRRYAQEKGLGPPDKVEQRPCGYRLTWNDKHTVYTPFVGGARKLKKLVLGLKAWSEGR